MAEKVKKETSHGSADFAKGGNTHMFGKQAAGPEKPGTTAHDVKGGAPGPSFAAGGGGKMFGFNGAVPARSGITSAR